MLEMVNATMGTPLPPNEPGDDCTTCFGSGKTFGDVVTPKFVWIQLFDYSPGPLWSDGDDAFLSIPHLLPQKYAPCRWESFDGNILLQWQFTSYSTAAIMNRVDPYGYYGIFGYFGKCLNELVDVTGSQPNSIAFGGTLKMWWDTEGL